MLVTLSNNMSHFLFDQNINANNNLIGFSLNNQSGICSSCKSYTDFNPDLFLDHSHLEKSSTINQDRYNSGITEAWWMD